MPNGNMTGEGGKVLFGKYLRYESHVFMHVNARAIGDGNAGTFLATMLQGI